jgi:hypothetical protein
LAWIFHVISFPLISPPKSCIDISSTHTCYMSFLSTFFRFDHPNNIWWGYRSSSSSLSFLHSPVTSFLLDTNILLSTLFSYALNLTFLPQFERPSFRPKQKNRQNYSYVYLNLRIFITNFKGLNILRYFPYMNFTFKYSGILAFKVNVFTPELHNLILN